MYHVIRLLLLVAFAVCITVVRSNAQDLSGLKAEQLSDHQIKELIQRAETLKYSDVQLTEMIVAQGMEQGEAANVLQRIQRFREEEKQNAVPIKSLPDQQIENVFEPLGPEIFGAALFKNTNITFQPSLNMPTPEEYIIGPGDELLIDLTGDNEANYKLKVSPEGYINIEYVGKIGVSGLSIEEGRSKIKAIMSHTYAALTSGRSSISVNLGNMRSIKITILGEVIRPGSYTLSSLSTVFNALYASGGPNKNGSFRTIEVIRNNKVVATVDIYDFLLRGMQTYNIHLQDQDVIRVPVFETRVEIAGEVKRPALYEILPGERLKDVLNFSGNFTTQAYTASIKVFQNTERERRVADIPNTKFTDYEPHNGDKYIVEAILERFENRVEIKGAVFRPGFFELEPGLTLNVLIQKAAGLTEDAFLPRGYIYRLKPDNTQELIPFNVTEIVNGNTPDISLQREDIVQISSIFDLQDEYNISVGGAVRQPGTFKYADNMTLGSLIQMAGGFKEGASPNRIEIARRVKNSDVTSSLAVTAKIFTVDIDPSLHITDADFKMTPFDIITVRNLAGYEVQRQVKIEGEVLYPGTYTLENKDERVSDIVRRAGGLTAFAYANGASLNRPLGDNMIGKNAISGNEKKEEEKLFNFYRLSKDSSSDYMKTTHGQQVLSSGWVGIDMENILNRPHGKYDIMMQQGDIIQVPRLLQTVKVNGEVLRPDNILYSKRHSFKSYVNGAGGYTQNALRRRAFIQYANGSVAATRNFLFFKRYPAAAPGAEIFVPNRGPRERMNQQAWIGLGAAIVSMSAIVFSLFKN